VAPEPSTTLGREVVADLTIECPRCGASADVRFYGPCASCRDALGAASEDRQADPVEVAEYEPKMNVTPNAVALKDD
jgi:ribosomal protein L37E